MTEPEDWLGAARRCVVQGDPAMLVSVVGVQGSSPREVGASRIEGYALHRLAGVAQAQGNLARSEDLFRQTIALRRDTGYRRGLASSTGALAELLLDQGRTEEAAALVAEARELAAQSDASGAGVLAACRAALLPIAELG